MELLRNGHNLTKSVEDFFKTSTNLFIFVPYIKLNTLKELLEGCISCKAIVVRWEARDLILGASDIEVFELCREKGIKLFRNQRIHLKAFVDDYKRCLIGSANVSSAALNIPETKRYNYELGTIVEELFFDDRLYFETILSESLLVTDSIYQQILDQLPEKKRAFPNEGDLSLSILAPDKHFLISSLPMSRSIKTLTRIYLERKAIHDEELNCALHDLALYGIRPGLNADSFGYAMKESFFSHPFVRTFVQMVQLKGGQVYFGEAKDWIHKNCADVPLPRKWEITENLQILYKWLVELGDGVFIVDRPNHSERLRLSSFSD